MEHQLEKSRRSVDGSAFPGPNSSTEHFLSSKDETAGQSSLLGAASPLSSYGLFAAYGHPSNSEKDDGIPLGNSTPSICTDDQDQNPLLHLEPETQTRLLDEFWTWQNTWPLLVHKPLFQEDFLRNGVKGYFSSAVLSAMLSLGAQYTDNDQMQLRNVSADSLATHAKRLVLDQIERPSLSLTLAAALLSLKGLADDNLPSAFQYIGNYTKECLDVCVMC